MKVLQTLPQNDLNEIPQAAKEAEEAGFDMVCTMENRHDPFLALGVAAVATGCLRKGGKKIGGKMTIQVHTG